MRDIEMRFSANKNALEQELSLPINWCPGCGGRFLDLREHRGVRPDAVGLLWATAVPIAIPFADRNADSKANTLTDTRMERIPTINFR
jgi:hypothetical protein